jgi:hypothetical protein
MREILIKVREAKRGRISPLMVFLRELMTGTVFALSDKEKTKRKKGTTAAAIPIRQSRSRCSVRGNNAMPHTRAKTRAMTKAPPSTTRASPRIFDRTDIE